MRIFVIGAGGVGSWLAPSLCLLTEPRKVVLVDGDTLEEKNLNRQLFRTDDIGMNKAEALALRYGCDHLPQWYSTGLIDHDASDWLLVCVDNHPARVACLQTVDQCNCQAIFAANEVHSSDAYYYRAAWRGTALDPRVRWPELLTDHTGDPRAAAIGCTGEAQVANRQLVSANFSAAALAQNLFVLWAMEAPKLDQGVHPRLPYHLISNLSKLESRRICDDLPQPTSP